METYALKPKEVECYSYDGGTDVIMRQNIHQVEQYSGGGSDGSESTPQLIWECEEKQFRVPGTLTVTEICADIDTWWRYVPPISEAQKTDTQRIDELEKKNSQLQAQIDALIEGRTSNGRV